MTYLPLRPGTRELPKIPLPTLEQLYRSHGPAVLRRARRLLGEEQEAQEVLHDVFTSLLQRPEQFSGRCSPMTFLYRMTSNAALDRLRSRQNRVRLLRERNEARGSQCVPSSENLVQLRKWLSSLPEELAQVALYYHLDDMSQDEIAKLLGCSRQRVGKLLAQLRSTPTHEEYR